MPGLSLPLQRSFGETKRRDNWWLQPGLVFLGLSAFIVYATVAALLGRNFWVPHTNYLSPFYSPVLFDAAYEHAWFGALPKWWPSWLPESPAIFILWAPAGFRLTCYYYRGAYYKAFWADPPNCAVGEPRKGYIGESNWPLRIQNIHRYFLYIAILFIVMLSIDAVKSFSFDGQFGIGVGTLILTANVILLSGYTFGCHSLRHLVGGRRDCLTASPTCNAMYRGCSALNRRHMLWAWTSLFMVMFADLYVRIYAMRYATGAWTSDRIF